MGLFSSKKVVTVNAATMHLIDASATPVKDAVLTAILMNHALVDTIIETVVGGMGVKMRRAHKYAKEHYTLELPTGKTTSVGGLSNATIAPYIVTDLSLPHNVNVTANLYTPLSIGLVMLPFLMAERGYNPHTAAVSVLPPGIPVHVDNKNIPLETRVSVKNIDFSGNGLNAEIVYKIEVFTWTLIYDEERHPYQVEDWVEMPSYMESLPIPNLENIVFGEECLYAFYQKYNLAGDTILPEIYPWIYRTSTNLYPALHSGSNTATPDEFLPVVPIRYKNEDLTDASRATDPLHITSKALLKKLGLDFEHLGSLVNENPNVADMDHAYVIFGVNLQTESKASLLYLSKFFDHLYEIQQKDELDFINYLNQPSALNEAQNSYRTSAGDSFNFTEHGLDLTIHYDYITSEIIPGTIDDGKVGNVRKSSEEYLIVSTADPIDPGN